MKGLGLSELGQGVVNAGKAVADATKIKQGFKIAGNQVTGKWQGTSHSQQKAPDAFGDFGKLFEQNQSQQTPSMSQMPTQAMQQQAMNEKFAGQQKADQAKLAATRNALKDLEEEMKRIREERERKWAEENKQEEEEKKMEELQQEEQKKQQPVRAGSPNPEGGKKKG